MDLYTRDPHYSGAALPFVEIQLSWFDVYKVESAVRIFLFTSSITAGSLCLLHIWAYFSFQTLQI